MSLRSRLSSLSTTETVRLTTHVQSCTHKVACEGDERDDAALDSWVKSELGVLKDERAGEGEDDAEGHRDGELEQEDGDSVEERADGDALVTVELGQGPARREAEDASVRKRADADTVREHGEGDYSLVENDGDGIIEERFSKDDGEELRVDLVRVEDGDDSDGIRC